MGQNAGGLNVTNFSFLQRGNSYELGGGGALCGSKSSKGEKDSVLSVSRSQLTKNISRKKPCVQCCGCQ